jgi:hypothetical protein
MKHVMRTFLIVGLLAGLSNLLDAQSLFGTILGTVTDHTNAVVPGARVTVRNIATNEERIVGTGPLGDYEALALPIGAYEVSCEAAGFKRAVRSNVILRIDQRLRVDLKLMLGALQETVQITATMPLIETDTASQGTVVENRRIVELPLNGRNFQQLASLGPGVIAPPPGSGERFSVAGVRGTSNSFMLDGATNSQPSNDTYVDPSIELIEEFKIQRNTFNAEYGKGAAQINVVTKSGTNQPHVTLFEFLRNEQLQARDFFDGGEKPALRRNQFGGTASGPIVRNRFFGLFNYEGVRQRSPDTLLGGFPVQKELNGDLSGTSAAVRDPFTRLPFANNRIPVSLINSTTQKFRQYVPVTDALLGTYGRGLNFIRPVSHTSDSGQFTIKLDGSVTKNINAFARYTTNHPTATNRKLADLWDSTNDAHLHNFVVGLNQVIKPNLINEFRLSWGRRDAVTSPRVAAAHESNFAQELGITNTISGAVREANALPTVTITGLTAMGGPAWVTERLNTYSLVDNLSWVKGKHTFKYGADIRRSMVDQRNIGATNGAFSFTGAFSGAPLGDYLLGIAQTSNVTAPPGIDGVSLSTLWQGFAQDDWKVTPNLTLSFGTRYEYSQPYVNSRNRISRFDTEFPGGRLIYPGEAVYFIPGRGFLPSETGKPLASRGLYKPDKNNIAPRLGFAWRPFGNNYTVFRGSYGVFSESPNELSFVVGINNTPHLIRQSITNDVINPKYRWSELFPLAPPEGSTQIGSAGEDLPTGYIQQWSFNVQRQLARNLALEVGYMGNKATKLDQTVNVNQALLDTNPAKPTPIVTRVPYPAFAPNMVFYQHTGFSNYHALIARLEREFSGGLSFLASYTFSKMIDNSSFRGSIGAQPAFPQNSYDLKAEHGLSYFDVPHRFVMSWVWDLPFGKGRRYAAGKAVNHILGGWQLVGIFQYQSGNPWPILVSGDWANVGAGNERANIVGDPFPPGFVRGGVERLAFSTSAFALPTRGTFGNSGRNIIRDAPLNNWDLGGFKNFRLGERARLQFRAELFNAWNHTQFQQFSNNMNSATFGTWNSARSPRIIQLGLKLVY